MAALKGSKTEANLTAVTTPITPCVGIAPEALASLAGDLG